MISETKTTLSSVCVPQMIRERTSVDWTFVPIRWSLDGASSCAKRWPFARNVSKSYGARTGANTAMRMNASVIAAPTHSIHRACPRASNDGRERPAYARQLERFATGSGSVRALDGHQYRILGSMYALTKSMTRLDEHDHEREDDDDALHRDVVAVLEVVDQRRCRCRAS